MIRKIGSIAIIRLLAMVIVLFVMLVLLQLIPRMLAPQLTHLMPRTWLNPAAALVGAVVMIGAYRLLVRWLEGRKADELAIGPSIGLILPGVALGFGLFCTVFVLLWASGHASWPRWVGTSGMLTAAATSVSAAVGEELVFRGALFRIVEDAAGTLAAVILSATVFGLLHAINRGATPVSTAAIALEAGVLLAAAYAATRTLWFPIGLHFGWNFTEGGVFGASVSGGQSHGLFDTRFSGPELWSGGAFGPEASLVAVGVCLLFAAILLWTAHRRGRWISPRFRMVLA